MTLKEMFTEFQQITVNENIILRQVKPEQDCKKYFEIYSDADAMKYYLGYGKPPANLEQAKKIIQNTEPKESGEFSALFGEDDKNDKNDSERR